MDLDVWISDRSSHGRIRSECEKLIRCATCSYIAQAFRECECRSTLKIVGGCERLVATGSSDSGGSRPRAASPDPSGGDLQVHHHSGQPHCPGSPVRFCPIATGQCSLLISNRSSTAGFLPLALRTLGRAFRRTGYSGCRPSPSGNRNAGGGLCNQSRIRRRRPCTTHVAWTVAVNRLDPRTLKCCMPVPCRSPASFLAPFRGGNELDDLP